MVTFHIITLFPEVFDPYLKASIIGRAIGQKRIAVHFYNPRDFTKDKHRKVDDRPYGGGPGMVLAVDPILKAAAKAIGRKRGVCTILLSAGGKQFTNTIATELANTHKHIVLIAGRYEGVDARVKKILGAEECSVGPYVLTGGELPALTIIDAVARHIPKVLGKQESIEEFRAASNDVYTRPEVLVYKGKKYPVPKILLGGHHKNIEAWREKRIRRKAS